MLFECKILSRHLNFIHIVSNNAGYVRNAGYIVVECIDPIQDGGVGRGAKRHPLPVFPL